MKKTAKQELFVILKSLVDSRVPRLKSDLENGVTAVKRMKVLARQIDNAQRYLRNSMYDRADALETMAEINEYENEIANLRPVCSRASSAGLELTAAKNFYDTYNTVEINSNLERLRREYAELENRSDKLDDLIFGCEVNMDPQERSTSVYEQANKDVEQYRAEYEKINFRMGQIAKEIKKLNGR